LTITSYAIVLTSGSFSKMKTLKKLGLGLSLLTLIISFLFTIINQRAIAATTYTTAEYQQQCAYVAVYGVPDTGSICNINPRPGGSASFTYGDKASFGIPAAIYQTEYGPTPPPAISLVNSNDKPYVAGKNAAESLALNNFTYTGQSGVTTTKNLKFYVYKPGAGYTNRDNFSLLASINPDGKLLIIALMQNTPYNGNQVYAVSIKKTAEGLTSTGSKCSSSDTSSSCTPTPPANTDSAENGNSCEAQNNTGFEWILCGALRALDGFMNIINKQIQEQLVINVKSELNPNVHQAWGVFRTLASAMLVIIMLIMVFSQAISAGPFDAYTIRKMLPRLVAAVILIQLSWVFSGWLISLANDVGNGLAQLISVPFGGADELGFDKLIGQLGAAAPIAFTATTLLSVGIAIALNPFGALLLAFFIVTSSLVAIAVLLVRQALIIGAVIFMPLALVAWILPGTQKYWKLLWDNFIRALLLFPIIIGLIYIGRVFVGRSKREIILAGTRRGLKKRAYKAVP
jgi:hypothetical protein